MLEEKMWIGTSRPLILCFLCLLLLSTPFCFHNAKAKKPNLIVLTIDTLRMDRLSCYGYTKIKTPHLDKLAEEGIIFTNAVCQVPLTLPSHCSIFTGRYPTAHGVKHNGIFKLDPEEVTLAEILREHDFETAAFVGSYILNSYFGLKQGFQTYSDIKITRRNIIDAKNLKIIHGPERAAEEVNADFFQWLPSVKEKRFFAWIHYYDPHFPYKPPDGTKKIIMGEGYDTEVSYSDQCVGDLLKKLEDLSLLENTIILFCSDHGESLGEHGELAHGIFIYDCCMRIPLIIRAPWMIQKAAVYEGLFETVDIMPTLLDLLGLDFPSTVQGESFAKNILNGKFLEGKKESYAETCMPIFEYGWSDLKSIRKADRKYINAPIPEMYDLISDPDEISNLYNPSNEESQELAEGLNELISRITPPEADPFKIEQIDEEKTEILRSLGYLSGDYFKMGKIDPSQQRIDPKLAIEEENIVLNARRMMAEGKFKEAIVALQNVLSRNPKNYQARLNVIKILLVMEENEKAEIEASKAIKIAELDQTAMAAMGAEIWNIYGYLLEKKNDREGAFQAYKKAFELHPNSEISFVFLASFYISHKEFAKAIEIIKEALTVNPDNVLANTYLFNIHMEKKDLDQAVKIAKKLVRLDLSDDIQTLLLAANLLKKKGMLSESAIGFEQGLRIRPQDKEILGNTGSLYLMMKDYNKAEKKFEEVLQIDSNEYKAYFYLGVIALKRNDEEEARKRFKRVLSIEPTYYPVYDALGSWLKEKGRMDEAKEEFRKALTLNPEDQVAFQALKSLK